jgi:hypothetical protein
MLNHSILWIHDYIRDTCENGPSIQIGKLSCFRGEFRTEESAQSSPGTLKSWCRRQAGVNFMNQLRHKFTDKALLRWITTSYKNIYMFFPLSKRCAQSKKKSGNPSPYSAKKFCANLSSGLQLDKIDTCCLSYQTQFFPLFHIFVRFCHKYVYI